MDEEDIIVSDDIAPLGSESAFGQVDEDPTGDPEDIVDLGADELAALESEEYYAQRDFGNSWQFDYANNRFFTRGDSNQVATTTDRSSFAQWVMSALHTERLTAYVCTDRFGVEFEKITRSGMRSTMASGLIMQAIDEALQSHDRYVGISDFTAAEDGDYMLVTMTIATTDGQVDIQSRVQV